MTKWPVNPKIYEINTWVWLNTLSQERGETFQLNNIPDDVVDEIASYNVDAVWMMGVWYRGPATRASALNYIHEYEAVLPDVTEDDVIGSAYAIGDYRVDERIGGREGLAKFREQLRKHGIRLVLDFVPNHVATDHLWLQEHPDYFVTGGPEQIEDPNFFTTGGENGDELIVAHGRDPYFPGWIDTAQLNAFSPGYRQATIDTLKVIASQCDGVRCDMAMLMMNNIFHQTWSWLGLAAPEEDYWPYVIPRVLDEYPNFQFIAEAYWGLEYELQLQGFHYTYDKTLYDRLVEGNVGGIYAHLGADPEFLKRNIRFIENHDEPRAATSIGVDRSRPAATLICTLPGATLLHDGQFVGRRVKLPVQIKRQPQERLYPALKQFYLSLLEEARAKIYREGTWTMFGRGMAIGNFDGHENVMAYGWHMGKEYRLIVLNLSSRWSQAVLDLTPWAKILGGKHWEAYDVLHDTYIRYAGDEVLENGLHVDLDAGNSHIYELTPVKLRRRTKKKQRSREKQS